MSALGSNRAYRLSDQPQASLQAEDGLFASKPGRPRGHPFTAELDLAEFHDVLRPPAVWSARAAALSRSHIVCRSRRMVYPGRLLGVVIHLIDANPTVLLGKVAVCDYERDGQYLVDVDLMKMPQHGPIARWASKVGR